MEKTPRYWYSLLERAARAFAVAFLAIWLGPLLLGEVGSISELFDLAVLDKALLAGIAAIGSMALSLLGGSVGNRGTPSLLPAEKDPATKEPVPSGTDVRVARDE